MSFEMWWCGADHGVVDMHLVCLGDYKCLTGFRLRYCYDMPLRYLHCRLACTRQLQCSHAVFENLSVGGEARAREESREDVMLGGHMEYEMG